MSENNEDEIVVATRVLKYIGPRKWVERTLEQRVIRECYRIDKSHCIVETKLDISLLKYKNA